MHTLGKVARWMARTLGLLYFGFISLFVVAHAVSPEGLLPIWRAPVAVQLDMLALFLMVLGAVIGWRWEGVAAVMLLAGTAL